jgi:hypothetical protein
MAHIYDAMTDEWTAVSNTNYKREGTSVVLIQGRLIAVGGWDPDTDKVEEYNVAHDTWYETSKLVVTYMYVGLFTYAQHVGN